jgi:hypothetical protein
MASKPSNKTALRGTDESERSQKGTKFPIVASEHGSTMTTVIVGADTEWPARKFTIHKNLLCRASVYFDKALNGPFKEGSEGKLELPNDFPKAFELFYHWLYSGAFAKTRFYNQESDDMSNELFWYEVYKFAECRLLLDIQKAAFNVLLESFDNRKFQMPCIDFVECLFDPQSEGILLQKYIAAHMAYWIRKKSFEGDWERFEKLFNVSGGRFGAQVALRLTKLCSKRFDSTYSHPCHDESFRDYRSFGSFYPLASVVAISRFEGQIMRELQDQHEKALQNQYEEEMAKAANLPLPDEDDTDENDSDEDDSGSDL